jgi:hypothetical protein
MPVPPDESLKWKVAVIVVVSVPFPNPWGDPVKKGSWLTGLARELFEKLATPENDG